MRFTGPGFFGGFCFASFSRACSSFSPWDSMWSFAAAACSCWLFLRNLDFGTLCPEVSEASGPGCSPSGAWAVCDQVSSLVLFVFRFILHILRAGSQQVIDFSAREPIHKRNGYISIEQQPLTGIAVCDIVATAGMLGAGSKQVGQRMGCRGAVYPGQFNFTAKILVTEIKGQAPHPAVLRPWLQFSARWPLPR